MLVVEASSTVEYENSVCSGKMMKPKTRGSEYVLTSGRKLCIRDEIILRQGKVG